MPDYYYHSFGVLTPGSTVELILYECPCFLLCMCTRTPHKCLHTDDLTHIPANGFTLIHQRTGACKGLQYATTARQKEDCKIVNSDG